MATVLKTWLRATPNFLGTPWFLATLLALIGSLGSQSFAAESISQQRREESHQPYIDLLKEKLGEERPLVPQTSGEVDSYIQTLRKNLGKESELEQQLEENYTEKLKAAVPELASEKKEPGHIEPYIRSEKAKLEPKPEGGTIAAVQAGNTELKPRMEGSIHHAFGLRYGAALTRNLTAPEGVQLRGFNDMYGSTYAPDVSLFYEFQLLHSEVFGNLGIRTIGGIGYFQGTGQFGFQVPREGGQTFSSQSTTRFQFFLLPVVVAAVYQFNLFKYLRPFVAVGPAAIGYVEMRNDPVKGNRGHSEGAFYSAGVSLLLDWIAPRSSWDLYTSFGIQHYYLTAEYSAMTTFNGDVKVDVSGLTAGISFEY